MLNGMPIQMLTRIADSSATPGLLSHGTPSCGTRPTAWRAVFSMPWSWSRMRRQTTAETTMGTSHGSSRTARTKPESRKRREKKTARARPMVNWPSSEPTVNRAVCHRASVNSSLAKTARQLSRPLNGASPVK